MPLIQVLEVLRTAPDASGPAWALDQPLDGELVGGTELTFSGWVVAPEGVAAVEVQEDDVMRARARVNRPRADVGIFYPDFEASARGGFRASVQLADWRETRLTIVAITSSGNRSLLAEVRARRLWREVARAEDSPLVSVVIAAREPIDHLAATVESVRAQTHPHIEIVLVGPLHVAAAIVARYAGVRGVTLPESSLANAWNTGIRRTTGDYLLFLNTGERLCPDALAEALTAFRRRPELALVVGHWRARAQEFQWPNGSVLVTPCGLGLFRRSVFDHIVGFSTQSAEPMTEAAARIARQFPCQQPLEGSSDFEPAD